MEIGKIAKELINAGKNIRKSPKKKRGKNPNPNRFFYIDRNISRLAMPYATIRHWTAAQAGLTLQTSYSILGPTLEQYIDLKETAVL